MRFWEQVVKRENPILGKGIELGARGGRPGILLCRAFRLSHGCSDVEPIPDDTRKRLTSLGLSNLISYDIADASSLPYPDETFDFVTFKSILGVVGARQRYDKIEQAIQEIHRVLRPGGLLLFAENLPQGGILHRKARHWFVPWVNRSWRYLTPG
ncbi:MAG: methyltransferase domain-containing protein [Lewinellaceae bacterium]|nr:methyltransferase domain-containing protein [Lewinellaceae bacterium]